MELTATEVKKELYKSKVNAKFSHYVSGNLYYTVELECGTYQFPIATVETHTKHIKDEGILPYFKLSSDLGTTEFGSEMKASHLNRWIAKAIDKDEFIKVS